MRSPEEVKELLNALEKQEKNLNKDGVFAQSTLSYISKQVEIIAKLSEEQTDDFDAEERLNEIYDDKYTNEEVKAECDIIDWWCQNLDIEDLL
jgi:hypothetical protein